MAGSLITEPTAAGRCGEAVMLYLQRVDAGLDELYEARVVLEEIACDLRLRTTEPRGRAELRRPGGRPVRQYRQEEPTTLGAVDRLRLGLEPISRQS